MALHLNYDNPADDTSRALNSKNLGKIKRWFNNPEFLWSCKETWLGGRDNTVRQINESDPELKNEVRVNLARINYDVISTLESLTLNWLRMKIRMAMVILSKNKRIKRIKKQISDKQSRLLDVEMLENAATVIACIGVSTPFKNNTPLFFAKAPLSPANCPSPPFLAILPYILVFRKPH